MNPELVRLVRDVIAAQKKLTAAGTPLSQREIDAYLREESKGKYTLDDAHQLLSKIDTGISARNLGRSAAQGLTFDFGDELLGLLPQSMGGGDDAKEEMRLRQDLFRDQHPVADGVAGIAGSLPTALLFPGGEAATVAKTVARGAAFGAGAGALAGAGRGEGGVGDRASGAAVGGLLGAGLGAAIPTAAGAYAASRPAAVAGRRLGHAIEESGGADQLRGVTMDFGIADRGKEVTLADLSDRLRLEADFAANNNDDALAKIAGRVQDRNREASARLLKDTKEVYGGNPRIKPQERALRATTQAVGRDAIAPIRAANPQLELDPATVATLQDPVVSAALAKARTTGMIGPNKDLGNPSFNHLQDVKEALDDAITGAFKGGETQRASKLKEAREVITNQLAKVSGYTDAMLQYARAKANERALQSGVKAWAAEDADDLAEAMATMSPDAAEQFRHGLAAKLLNQLKNTKTNRNAAKELMDASVAMQQKLKVVFGSKASFDRYMSRVAREADLGKLKGVFSNSATHRRAAAAGFDPIELTGQAVAEGGLPSPARMAINFLGKMKDAKNRAVAGVEGDALMTQGADNINSFLDTFTNPEPLLGRIAGTTAPIVTGAGLTPRPRTRDVKRLFNY